MSKMVKKKGGGDEGAPGWIVTFADLMSLLLTFFVLILSFAEIDASKFKRVMGSIKMAFGVQEHKIYEFMESSRTPFEKKSRGKDSDKVIQSNMNNHVLSVNANELCGLEEKANQIQQEKNDVAHFELHKKLNAETRLTKYFKILLDKDNGRIKVAIKPEKFFYPGTTRLRKERVDDLNLLFKKMADKELKVHITNHASNLSSKSNFKSWKLASERSLTLAYLSKKFPQTKNHQIDVKSLTEGLGDDPEKIEFDIQIK